MERLTTDNRKTNLQTLMNYAYAKDKAVHLVFGNDQDNITLDEYIAHEARERGCPTTAKEVMDGGCMECDCPIAILNAVSIQAAELRARLMMIEDILGDNYDLDHLQELMKAEKEGRLVVLPCKPGKQAYIVYDLRETDFHGIVEVVGPYHVCDVSPKGFWIRKKVGADRHFRYWRDVGKTVFWSKQKAEAARDAIIAKDNNVPGKTGTDTNVGSKEEV